MEAHMIRSAFERVEATRYEGVQLIQQPVKLQRDPSLSEEELAKLDDATGQASQKRYCPVLLADLPEYPTVFLLNRIQHRLKLPLCWVDCPAFARGYQDDRLRTLARLLADAQAANWLVVLTEAQALFEHLGAQNDDPLERSLGYLEQSRGMIVIHSAPGNVLARLETRLPLRIPTRSSA
ncbi:hypothetical protein LJ739_17885 [Aestuariibacter halophilus]|uniref:Uncharacterized protein n=1 Tax=Fluctibacter halophilus TaxID=226011 RepID=A0ABS8GD04_9ALTE|nr:hypothetical protein [Aestuariibacter halophilus]MCC2618131.1 hypothetical protein [Aestuariibacter halophilus]